MRVRILTLLVASLCLARLAHGDDAPKDHVLIDIKRPVWEPMVLINQPEPSADNVSIDLNGEHPIFTSHEPGANGIFEYRFHAPIDSARYPFLIIKYKAKNLDTSKEKACISVDDTGGRGAKKDVLPLNQFVADGEEHELKKDLREIQPRGAIGRVIMTLNATEAGDASMELIGIEFDSDPSAPPVEVKDDSALQIAVLDKDSQPIKGAKVSIDAERKDSARTGETDDKGEVIITPRETESGSHALQVEAEGKATYYATIAKGAPGANVNMTPGTTWGGIVKNEDGQPIEGATVRIFAPPSGDTPAADQIHMLRRAVMKTDAEGKWKSPLLPESDNQPITKLAHPDYIADKEYRNKENEPSVEEMKAGTGVMVLKK